MATWEVTDAQGRTFEIDGPNDRPPTEGELKLAFAAFDKANPEPPKNNPLLALAGQTVENAGAKLTKGQEITRAVSPYARTALEMGGMIGGGAVGTAAGALSVNPVVAGGTGLLGAGLGYAGGRGIANVIDEYAGLRKPPTLTEAAKNTAEDVVTGAAMQAGGDVAGPILSAVGKGVGKVVKPTLGALSGTGEAPVSNVIRAGYSTGFRANPFKSQTAVEQAMRGNAKPDEIVEVARNAIGDLREMRGANYRAILDEISANNKSLDVTPINETLQGLMRRYNVKVNPDGTLDMTRSSLGKKGTSDIEEMVNIVRDWGSKDGDFTPSGLDILKRKLDDFYSESGQARQFVTELKKSVHKTISNEVPQYAEMTKGYEEATSIIKDIESAMMLRKQGMSGRVTADATLRRITSAMKDNNELRLDMVRLLGSKTGNEIEELAAGYAMNKVVPNGLARYTAGGVGALTAMINPQYLPIIAAASPRVQGEFLLFFGKGLGELGRFNKTFTGPASKMGGILLRNSNQE
jgi:hypothetical protein